VSTPRQRSVRFLSAIRAQVKARHLQIDRGTEFVLGTLVELQERLKDTLEGTPSDFEAHRIPQLLAELDRQVERWRVRAIGETEKLIEAAWEMGPRMIEAPLAAAEVHIGRVLLPDALLDELKDYSASKISNVTPIIRQRIEREISITVLGGQSPHEAMKAVGEHLGERPMRFVSFRTETIVRTEMGRVHSEAAHRSLANAAKIVSGLKKKWQWSFKSRPMHEQINGQIRDPDQPFTLPDQVEMQYPRELGAPVEHVANCGCESVPHKDDW